jgi:hypothetical protein
MTGRPGRGPLAAVWHDDRGLATNIAVLLMAPLAVALILIGVQATLWRNARTIAADRANQTAALVAAGQLTPAAADAELTASLDALADLTNVDVDVVDNGQLVTVTVAGDARGIIVGTRNRVRLTSATPVEGWQPLP